MSLVQIQKKKKIQTQNTKKENTTVVLCNHIGKLILSGSADTHADKQAQMLPFLFSTQPDNRRLGDSAQECKCVCVDWFPCLVENADF